MCFVYIEIGYSVELVEFDDVDSIVKFKSYDLKLDDFRMYLENGMFVILFECVYKENLMLIFKDDGLIKKFKFFDVLKEENSDIFSEDMVVKLDVDFVLFSIE